MKWRRVCIKNMAGHSHQTAIVSDGSSRLVPEHMSNSSLAARQADFAETVDKRLDLIPFQNFRHYCKAELFSFTLPHLSEGRVLLFALEF